MIEILARLDWATVLFVLITAILLPFSILAIRHHVGSYRLNIIKDISDVFKGSGNGSGNGNGMAGVPSIELVKRKYTESQQGLEKQYWYLSVLMYCLLCAVESILVFDHSRYLVDLDKQYFNQLLDQPCGLCLCALLVSCAGAYIWNISYLIRRAANYDLFPISFVRAAFGQIQGPVVALILVAVLMPKGRNSQQDPQLNQLGTAVNGLAVFGLAFLAGMFPTLGLRNLASRFPIFELKRVSAGSSRIMEEIPLDVITGIDPYIKFRLSEFEIEDVQNLATKNPIELYVETPYGLYEIIDWIAQAQLVLAVGAEKVSLLKNVNIRTIFDLERAMRNEALSKRLLPIILGIDAAATSDPALQWNCKAIANQPAGNSAVELDFSCPCQALLACIRDDLHVKRLRQIWDVIEQSLDERGH